jgi:D-arabinose 1-dehydrogenase-like Zn-dependent alcohol dehydrogenase
MLFQSKETSMNSINSTIGGRRMLGTVVVQNTFETIELYTDANTHKVSVNVDFRGYYTVEQLDDLIAILEDAKIAGRIARESLQHENLFNSIVMQPA